MKLSRELFLASKHIAQALKPSTDAPPNLLLILGCQRSGTTMMLRILELDPHSRVYGELSKLTENPPQNIRLKSLPIIGSQIRRLPASPVVLKPLVESQRAHALLDYFPNAQTIWMYRHYKDVAASNLNNFGANNGLDDIRPIVEGDPHNWRSESVSEPVRALLREFYPQDLSSYEAAALFWYARNSLFFEQKLERHARVRLYRYRDMVNQPKEKLREIYQMMELPFPEKIADYDISSGSVGKGKDIHLRPEIEAHCAEMLSRLDAAGQQQQPINTTAVDNF
jgi:hypothetical protein